MVIIPPIFTANHVAQSYKPCGGYGEKGLKLNARIDPDVPLLLKADESRLRQIITNLIGNAIKFTPTGTITLQIKTDGEDENHITLRFLVQDCGIGISPDKRELIFERFTQGDSSTTREYGGSGLGLTISRQLAEMMGGTIGVESSEGKGSLFWFTAVLEKTTEEIHLPSPIEKPSGEVSTEKATGNAFRLLLVEDDPTNQLVTTSILAKYGYRVDSADNGREALRMLEHQDYALVLMDCMMPLMNGYEVTAVIRDQASAVRDHSLPVIALTANAMREDRDTCLAAGMDDYLSKPVDISDLLAILERWLPPPTPGACNTAMVAQGVEPSREAATAVFDMAAFVSRNMEDLELSRDVAAIFIQHGPGYVASIREAVAADDAATLRLQAHKLKGAAANIALEPLRAIAARIESSALTGDMKKGAELLPELERQFERATDALRGSFVKEGI